MKRLPLAVTMGDPGGIGPEVILGALRRLKCDRPVLIIGKPSVFKAASQALGRSFSIPIIHALNELSAFPKNSIVLFDMPHAADLFVPRRLNPYNGRLGLVALDMGIQLAVSKKISALVTAPLCKKAIARFDKNFLDQTTWLQKKTRAKSVAMAFVKDRFCVTLATMHLPLRRVPSALSPELIIEKVKLTTAFLKRSRALTRPHIGVLGLNPHAGEGGLLGSEETHVIVPAILKLRRAGFLVDGPLPADTAFYLWQGKKYDALVAMYHDQGLAPFKMLYFHEGVHLTLGLPFVRTSPDHGTAFSLAYRGKANASAMYEAMNCALRLTR